MITPRSALEHRQLRAPREHGAVLVDPPLDRVPELIAHNRALHGPAHRELWGQAWADAVAEARSDLRAQAFHYTRAYLDVPAPAAADVPLLVTGHQPELYHPGVWFKNFALSAAARRSGAHAIHILIDNDAVATPSVRVPCGSLAEPGTTHVALDGPAGEMPYEERAIVAAETFASFAPRVLEQLLGAVDEPVITALWPRAQQAARQTGNLGRAISQARHQLEAAWGLTTQEVPLSYICRGPVFRRFLTHVLADLPRFRDIYNAALRDYRHVHRLRSRTHPVPELAQRDEWHEAPFWIWTASDPRRRRLYARPFAGGWEISDLQQTTRAVTLMSDTHGSRAVEQWETLEGQGVRIRPRALLTTMFIRLLLSDVFFHGIGGAKYDQLTDVIIERFFEWQPPEFLVLTATAQLWPAQRSQLETDLRQVEHRLRDLRFNPQRHVARNAQTEALVAEKLRWIHNAAGEDLRTRHQMLNRMNADLQPFVAGDVRQLLAQQQARRRQQLREQILTSREYSFCLHPQRALRAFLLDI
jgi:hypothetical protein